MWIPSTGTQQHTTISKSNLMSPIIKVQVKSKMVVNAFDGLDKRIISKINVESGHSKKASQPKNKKC